MERLPLPDHLVEHARAFAAGTAQPVEPRDAATVVLLRDAPGGGPELYLLRRQASMAFAGGMCVFPGGGVDDRDDDPALAWAGPAPDEWAERLGVDEELARALVCAAVRETFEESGVLLAGPDATSVVSDTTGEEWEADRVALESRSVSFADLLVRRGLVLRTDLLGAWSGWTTPAFEPRRYRTWFFVAVLPEGQRTRDVSTESSSVTWLPAARAVSAVEDGELGMLPPTWLTCLEVAGFDTAVDVLAAAEGRRVEMFTPEVVAQDGVHVLSTPERYAALIAERRGGA